MVVCVDFCVDSFVSHLIKKPVNLVFIGLSKDGGERGIRTLGTLARTRDFQSRPFGHSGISPKED